MSSVVEQVSVESDERGFELHLVIGEDVEVDPMGRLVLNVHGVAKDLYDQVVAKIGPWVAEGRAAEREYRTGIADDPSQQHVLDRIRGDR